MKSFSIGLFSLLLHVGIYVLLAHVPEKAVQEHLIHPPVELTLLSTFLGQTKRDVPAFPTMPIVKPKLLPAQIISANPTGKSAGPVSSKESASGNPGAGGGTQLQSALSTHGLAELIHNKINAKLKFPEILLEGKDHAEATIPFEVTRSGKLVRIHKDQAGGDGVVIGLGLRAIGESLGKDLLVNGAAPSESGGTLLFTAHLMFDKPSQFAPPMPEIPAVSNRDLFFSRTHTAGAVFKATNLRKEGMPIQALNLDLLALYEKWFATPPPVNRMDWDVAYREKELRYHCRTGQAEGACFEIAKLLLLQGDVAESRRFRELACQQGLSQACENGQEQN